MTDAKTGTLLRIALLVAAAAAHGRLAEAQTFSADLVTTRGIEAPGRSGRVYVTGEKVRIETPDLTDGFFLVDSDKSTAWFVRPHQRLYMDSKQSSRLTQVFVPVDPANACRRWQIMEHVAGVSEESGEWHCRQVAADMLEGREVLKFEVVSRRNERSYRWIDPSRRFPVKWQAEDGATITVEHVADGPQPPTLFLVPPDYYKFDPVQLIELIKRSDVWVEPPPQ